MKILDKDSGYCPSNFNADFEKVFGDGAVFVTCKFNDSVETF